MKKERYPPKERGKTNTNQIKKNFSKGEKIFMKKKFLSIVLIAAMLVGIFAVDAIVAPGKTSAASTGTVTSQQEFWINLGGYNYEHQKFTVDDTYQGVCCEPDNYNIPTKGTSLNLQTISNSSNIAKAVYLATQKYSNTNEMLLKIGYAVGILNNDASSQTGMNTTVTDELINKCGDVTVPSNFEVIIGTSGTKQKIVMWRTIPVGYAQIIKTSSMPEVTNGNGYYGNINNAVFGVYDGNTKIGEIKANGPAVKFPVGNYTVKEINVPTNFFEMEIRNGEIVSGVTKKWEYENVPKMDPVHVLLKKVKADGTTSTKLAGAEYTVKYYAGTSATGTPEKTWVMKTGTNGMITMDAEHKVSGPAFYTDSKGRVSFPLGTVTIQETKAPAGFLVNPEIITVKVDGKTQAFSQANAPTSTEGEYGAIRIKKVDQNGKTMSGVVFGVYSDKNCTNKVASVTTNSLGEATYGYNSTTGEYSLEPGKTFYFKETSTLPGYQMSTEVFPVTVKDGTTTRTEKNAVNKELGAIRIRKVDQNGNPMAGVSFNVYTDAACTNKVAGVTTNTEGFATYGYNTETKLYTLTPGKTYYFKEASSLPGYQISTEVFPVTVVSGKTTRTEKNAVNKEFGAIRIKKVDQNGKAMSGVSFNVYTDEACTNKVAGVTTNAIGEATYGYDTATKLYTLEPGKTYYFKEASTLPGYQMSTEVFPVTVVSGKTTLSTKNAVNLEYGAIRIKKVNQDGKTLSGVVFDIYTEKACTNKVAEVTTDSQGIATYGYDTETKLYTLEPGKTYYFREAKALPGYILTKEVYPVTVISGKTTSSAKEAVNLEFGALGIKKVDQNGKPLAGVTFNLYVDEKCTVQAGSMVTDEKGIATSGGSGSASDPYTLVPGYFIYIREAKALPGYQLSKEVFKVKIASGKLEMVTKEAVNLQNGGLKIKKVDQDGNALSEAEFTVYSDEACTKAIGTMKTGDDGYATYGYDDATKVYSLTPGETYYVKETKAPAGFILTDEVFAIKIESGKITEAEKEAVNKPLKISKSNIVTGEPVEGATIIIKDAAEKVVFTGKTDKNGDTEKITLPPGTYTFTEGEAPEGYIKTDEEFTFTIEDNGNITGTTNFTNEPVPEIKTTAMFEDGTKDSLPTGTITLIDKVKTGKLVIGKEYTVKGTLVNRDDPTEIIARGETTFTATEAEMTVDVVFTFDASRLEGTTTVVFEDIYKDNIKLATHSEINDEDQTVRFPKIRTKVGESVMAADGIVTLTDTLIYENLTPGNTYKVSGSVMDKETGELLVIDGKEVKAEVEFSPKEENGKVSVEFTFDASTLSGKSVVVFEKVIDVKTGTTVGKHEDLEDKDQTVDFPEIKTTAMFDTGEKESPARKEVTVIDKVEAKNLTIGKEYTVKGTLVNVQDEKDIIAKAETTFTATEKNMVIDVVFKFDGSKLEGESVVVFEDLIHNKKVVATHSELNDKDQTVKFPKAKTKVSDSSIFAGKVSLTDTIFYEELTPKETYIAKGLIVDGKGNPIKVDGKEITAETEFIPESENGKVDVTFEFDAKTLEGTDIVIFEEIVSAKGNVVAEHKDVKDKDQTATVVKVKTKVSKTHLDVNKTMTLTDVIFYEGLTPKETYTAKGLIVDEKGNPIKVNGKEVTAETEFVPKKANGKTEVTFTFNCKDIMGKTVVVFEEVYDAKGKLIGEHKDVNDKDQTYYISEEPKTGDENTDFLIYGMTLMTSLLGVVIALKKKVQRSHE